MRRDQARTDPDATEPAKPDAPRRADEVRGDPFVSRARALEHRDRELQSRREHRR